MEITGTKRINEASNREILVLEGKGNSLENKIRVE
jgi:hypothetical protein